jgi:predicted metal-binding protein
MIELNFQPHILKNCFDDKVREQCRSCKRYNKSSMCPTNVPDVEYFRNLLPTYSNGRMFYDQFPVDTDNWEESGRASSLVIHNRILEVRNQLFKDGIYFCVGFTAGSCKVCKKCSYPCVCPEKSLIPLEGTGINVVKLMKHFEIDIKFPIEQQHFYFRVGVLLWN